MYRYFCVLFLYLLSSYEDEAIGLLLWILKVLVYVILCKTVECLGDSHSSVLTANLAWIVDEFYS